MIGEVHRYFEEESNRNKYLTFTSTEKKQKCVRKICKGLR